MTWRTWQPAPWEYVPTPKRLPLVCERHSRMDCVRCDPWMPLYDDESAYDKMQALIDGMRAAQTQGRRF